MTPAPEKMHPIEPPLRPPYPAPDAAVVSVPCMPFWVPQPACAACLDKFDASTTKQPGTTGQRHSASSRRMARPTNQQVENAQSVSSAYTIKKKKKRECGGANTPGAAKADTYSPTPPALNKRHGGVMR